MKLILTQEVTGLGAPGDVVEVKDGYGRNYLVPRGLGIRWTRGAEKTVESIKASRTNRAVRDHDHAEEIRTKLEAAPVNVQVRAGESGRLFGAVTVTDIAVGPGRGHRRGRRQAHDRDRQPDQVARRPRDHRAPARGRRGHRLDQRRPGLTLADSERRTEAAGARPRATSASSRTLDPCRAAT